MTGSVLPAGARRAAGRVWRNGGWTARALLRHGWPRALVHFWGMTPGDDLMCTAVLHELRRRGGRGLWMKTRFPQLFERNPDVDAVVPWDERYDKLVRWAGGRSWYAHYGFYDEAADRNPVPERHIIALMCQQAGITGRVTLRPYLHLSAEERAAGRLADRQVVLHSSGASAHSAMLNKEWGAGRMQAVVDALRGEYNFVQLGAPSDAPLEGARDLRGKTTMRESAAIIANARLFVGQVGFLMHLTRAVDRPAVIAYGGREMPWQSGYSCNTNLYTELPCAPCWRWNACDNPVTRLCLQRVTVEDVVEAVRALDARADESLAVDVDDVPPLPAERPRASPTLATAER